MIAINFTGELSELKAGLQTLSSVYGYTMSKEGLEIEVVKLEDDKQTSIAFDGDKGRICFTSVSSFFRLLNLWLYNHKTQAVFDIKEQPQFDKTGVMVDCSRNAVLTVDGMKELLREMAKLGLNQVMLYTEETYEVEEYPYFGYLRGSYSQKELKEMDDYAYQFGIEMVPCIQTLGHLYLALKYEYANSFKDTSDIVLVGDPKTYEFLENIIRAASEPFRTKRIHVGMDEAWGLGTGQYRVKNGVRDSFEIMNDHLKEVVAITEKLGLEPMMWSDMYYRFGSETGDYYDLESNVPSEIIEGIPEIDMVYWDYYHEDEAIYDTLITKHQAMNKKVIFAGGVWTWNGLAPNYGKSFETTKAGLASCKKNGVKEVFATLWGDDGGETPVLSALPGLQLFADMSYRDTVDEEQMKQEFEHNTGYAFDDFYQLNEIDETPGVMKDNLNTSATSKILLWQDPLLGLFDKTVEGLELDAHYRELAGRLEKMRDQDKAFPKIFNFYYQLTDTLADKAEFGLKLKAAYDKQDKEALQAMLTKAEGLKVKLENLRLAHQDLWMTYNKPFGWEVVDIRYGGTLARMSTTIQRLGNYLAGQLTNLPELEEEKLPFSNPYNLGEGTLGRGLYKDMVTAGKLSGV